MMGLQRVAVEYMVTRTQKHFKRDLLCYLPIKRANLLVAGSHLSKTGRKVLI